MSMLLVPGAIAAMLFSCAPFILVSENAGLYRPIEKVVGSL